MMSSDYLRYFLAMVLLKWVLPLEQDDEVGGEDAKHGGDGGHIHCEKATSLISG